MTHTAVKQTVVHSCQFCNETFVMKKYLKKHITTHMKTKEVENLIENQNMKVSATLVMSEIINLLRKYTLRITENQNIKNSATLVMIVIDKYLFL